MGSTGDREQQPGWLYIITGYAIALYNLFLFFRQQQTLLYVITTALNRIEKTIVINGPL